MTLVEAVLAATTLFQMYRTSRGTAVTSENGDAEILAALEACDVAPEALAGLIDPIALPPEPEDGDDLVLRTPEVFMLDPEPGLTWRPDRPGTVWQHPDLPPDAVFQSVILSTPTVEQQSWASPTDRFIVTISEVGGAKNIVVHRDLPMMMMA